MSFIQVNMFHNLLYISYYMVCFNIKKVFHESFIIFFYCCYILISFYFVHLLLNFLHFKHKNYIYLHQYFT